MPWVEKKKSLLELLTCMTGAALWARQLVASLLLWRTGCVPRPVYMRSGGVQSGCVLQCQYLACFLIFYVKVLDKGMSVPVLIN